MATINGSKFHDELTDPLGNDQLFGLEEGDYFFMSKGGNDLVNGGGVGPNFGHNAVLYGGTNVKLTIDLRIGKAVDANGFTDTLINISDAHGSTVGDTIYLNDAGGLGWGEAGADKIVGGLGNDYLVGGSGADIINGGGGFDIVNYFDGGFDFAGVTKIGVTVNLATGKATDNWGNADTLSNIENVEGSAFNDTITGNAGENYLSGGNGNDTISGGIATLADAENFAVFDTLYGDDGDDKLTVTTGQVLGGRGNDRLIGLAYPNEPDLTDTAVLYFDSESSVVANLSNKAFMGLAAGNATSGFRVSDGLAGTDLVSGMHRFIDSRHDDFINVGSTYTTALGNYLEVRLTGGDDTVIFTDVDTARISYRAAEGGGVYAELEDGFAHDRYGGSSIGYDVFVGANQFRGSRADDEIHGKNSGDAQIRGDEGDDDIFGNGGNDVLRGDSGDDILAGGKGADSLDGGDGSDWASYLDAGAAVVANLGSTATNTGDAAGDSFVSIENLFGSDFNDKLIGNASRNVLQGSLGADVLNGGGSIDTASYFSAARGVTVSLLTPAGNTGDAAGDSFVSVENLGGSTYNDRLTGNAAANLIAGGFGNDILDGGGAADTFYFDTGLSSLRNVDTIVAFNVAQDKIQLASYPFGNTAIDANTFTTNLTGKAQDANDRIIYETDTGNLYVDFNGTGPGNSFLFAKLDPGLSLTTSNFIVGDYMFN